MEQLSSFPFIDSFHYSPLDGINIFTLKSSLWNWHHANVSTSLRANVYNGKMIMGMGFLFHKSEKITRFLDLNNTKSHWFQSLLIIRLWQLCIEGGRELKMIGTIRVGEREKGCAHIIKLLLYYIFFGENKLLYKITESKKENSMTKCFVVNDGKSMIFNI